MPSTPSDARDLLISSVLSPDPVIYIDDRWLYKEEEFLKPVIERDLASEGPKILRDGNDLTVVACGYSTNLVLKAIDQFKDQNKTIELIDLRILNPIQPEVIFNSVLKTKKILCVDGGWSTCGMASEIISLVCEKWHAL